MKLHYNLKLDFFKEEIFTIVIDHQNKDSSHVFCKQFNSNNK